MRVRPHWIHFSGALGFALFVAVVGALLVRHNDLPLATDLRIVGWAAAIAALGFVAPLVRWRRTWIEVAGGVARCSSGLLRTRSVSVDLSRARHVGIERTALGRALGYGQLHVVDAQGVEHLFPPVGGVPALARALDLAGRRTSSRPG